MKLNPILFFVTVLTATGQLLAQTTVLTDDFNDGAVDAEKWDIILPFGGSAISEANGVLTTAERGTLFTKEEMPANLEVTGSFQMNHASEHFKVVLRSDGNIVDSNNVAERKGISFAFSNDGDQISIWRQGPDEFEILAVKSYPLTTGQSYSFRIVANGDSLSLSVNGTEELTTSSSYSSGNLVGIYSRELAGRSSDVDSLSIKIHSDTDGDGLSDSVETNTGVFVDSTHTGTDPAKADSDEDGVPDGLEVKESTDPNDPADFNGFSTGLVAYYRFDRNARDESGKGHNGNVAGATLDFDRYGNESSAYRFDGEDDYIDAGDRSAFDFGFADFSISAWVKLNAGQPLKYIIGKYATGSQAGYGIGTQPSSRAYAFLSSSQPASDNNYTETAGLDDGTWKLVTVSYDRDSSARVFVNGILDSQFDITTEQGYIGNDSPLLIGKIVGGQTFGGWIDDVRIYDRAISDQEARDLFQAERPIRYVNAAAAGSGNGTSWTNAYTSIQDALAEAVSGDQIWVASGIYKPSTTGDRSQSFIVPSGVALHGGFAGTESSLAQRSAHTASTILSGDLLDNDNGNLARTEPTRLDNSYHVVRIENATTKVILSGFVIESGHSETFRDGDDEGAGLRISSSVVEILDCEFRKNSCRVGASIWTPDDNGNLTVKRCKFLENRSERGGTIHVATPFLISESVFYDNRTENSRDGYQWGGALFIADTNGIVVNCIFASNHAAEEGGGVYNHGNTTFINCTFSGNSAVRWSSALHDRNNSASVRNCIFWGNTGTTYPISANGGSPGTSVSNSVVQGGYAVGGAIAIVSSDPLFANSASPLGDDGLLGTPDDGLRLGTGSPGIDAGNNSYVPAGTTTDIAGAMRFTDTVDLGAYEMQMQPLTTLALSPASDTGSTSSDGVTKLTQPEFIGATDPGVILELSSDIDGTLGSVTSDGSGDWTLQAPTAMSEGVHEITVSSGATAEPLTITIDATAPNAPPVPTLSAASDTGPSDSDAYTADNTPTLTGEAETGATVALTSNLDGVVGTGTASSSWLINANILQDGIHSLTATATDVAGNESSASPALSVTIDTTAPTVTVNQATGQNDPAAAGPIAFTAAFSEDVTGFDSSDVSVGGSAVGTPTVADGPATYTVYVVISSGEGTVNVTVDTSAAIDLAGNFSDASTSNDNRVTLDFHGNGSANATPLLLTAGIGSKSGWIEEGDVDAFTFTLAEPRIAMIYTTGAVDTRGELSDALGTALNNPSSDDDSGNGTNFQIVQPLPAGSYTVMVAANSGEDDYDLFIEAVDTPRIQPDLVIVKGLDNLIGDGLYTSLVGQRLTSVSRKARSVRALVQAQNKGEIRDVFRLGANRNSRWFRINYVSPVDGNVSAELTLRTLETHAIDPDAAPYEIEMTAKPIKRKIRKKIRRPGRRTRYRWLSKNFTARFSAISTSAETQRDDCVIGVKTR